MIAENDGLLVADIAQKARPFVIVHGDAFEIVISQLLEELRGIKIALRQTARTARNGHARRRVRMHDALRAGNTAMDGSVNRETRRVDWPLRGTDHPAIEVDA